MEQLKGRQVRRRSLWPANPGLKLLPGAYLQLQALVQHHAALHPGLLQVRALLVQETQLLPDLRAGIVPVGQQLLPTLLKCLEGASPGINFCPVFLPRGGTGLGDRQKMLPPMPATSSQQRVTGQGRR